MKQLSILFLGVLVLMASCGSSGSSSNGPKFSKGGYVGLTEFTIVYTNGSTYSTLSPSGSFFAYARPSSLPDDSVPATDECSMWDGTSFVSNISIPGNATALDAGEKLTIRNGELESLEAAKSLRGSFIIYGGETSVQGSLSSGSLTVDIPGGAFPAFTNAAFVNPPQIRVIEPSAVNNWEVTTDTTFNWEGQTNDLIIFNIRQLSPFIDTFCYAKNDGSFTFSGKTKAELSRLGFIKGTLTKAIVQGQRFETKDDIFVSLETQRSYTFIPNVP
jgi:hypothetical protein